MCKKRSDLDVLGETSAQSQEKRRQQSADYIKMGLLSLMQAISEDGLEPQALKQACQQFLKALRSNRKNIEAYVMLCFVFARVQDYSTAEAYLKQGLSLAPEHAGLHAFREELKQLKIQKQVAQASGASVLMDEIEVQIQGEIMQLLNTLRQLEKTQPPYPIGKPEELKQLKSAYHRLRKQYKQVTGRFKQLDNADDVDAFKTQLMPLEHQMTAYLQAIAQSHSLIQVQRDIEQETQAVNRFLETLSQIQDETSAAQAQERLEAHLDRCDQIADVLEHLEHQKIDIHGIETAYHQLLLYMELVQDMLDDMLFF